jgi:hypothetical protein
VESKVHGIEYSCDGALCFLLPGGGEGNDGTYTGNAVVTGYEDKKTGNSPEGTAATTPELDHGSQVNLGLETP